MKNLFKVVLGISILGSAGLVIADATPCAQAILNSKLSSKADAVLIQSSCINKGGGAVDMSSNTPCVKVIRKVQKKNIQAHQNGVNNKCQNKDGTPVFSK